MTATSTPTTKATPKIIDAHIHVYPDWLQAMEHKIPATAFASPWIDRARNLSRTLLGPVTELIHQKQPIVRHLPDWVRDGAFTIGAAALSPAMLLEGSVRDLIQLMDENGIHGAMVIAHPPVMSNEFVLDLAAQFPDRIFPVVNIAMQDAHPAKTLRDYIERGAKALKIHAASDGEDAKSPHYNQLLRVAADVKLPVILHTGNIKLKPFYKEPNLGDAEHFRTWFIRFKEVPFILAHMNLHLPQVALSLAERYPNLYVDTSWQPTEIIAEATRRLGASRVLFGTDWPIGGLGGASFKVGLGRIREAQDAGLISLDDANLIRGENAIRIFKLG